jgi:hypothetical protein
LLHLYLSFFPHSVGDRSDEHKEQLHHTISVMAKGIRTDGNQIHLQILAGHLTGKPKTSLKNINQEGTDFNFIADISVKQTVGKHFPCFDEK